MLRELLVVFLVVNALFWGLLPHSVHCMVVSRFTTTKCPPHAVHIMLGISCFILAVILAQTEYANELMGGAQVVASKAVVVAQSAGRIAGMVYASAKKNFTSLEDTTRNIERFVAKKLK